MYLQKLANVTCVALAFATVAFGQSVTLDGGAQIDYAAHLATGQTYINFQNTGVWAGINATPNICVNVYAFNAQTAQMVMCCSVLVVPNQTVNVNLTTDLARFGNSLFPDSATVQLVASVPATGSTPCNPATVTAGAGSPYSAGNVLPLGM